MAKIKPHFEIFARLDDIGVPHTERNIVMMIHQTLEDLCEPGHSLNELKEYDYNVWLDIYNSCKRISLTETGKKYTVYDGDGEWDV